MLERGQWADNYSDQRETFYRNTVLKLWKYIDAKRWKCRESRQLGSDSLPNLNYIWEIHSINDAVLQGRLNDC